MSGVITPAQTMGIDPITFQVLNNAFSVTNNAWQTPTAILPGRLFKVGVQMDF